MFEMADAVSRVNDFYAANKEVMQPKWCAILGERGVDIFLDLDFVYSFFESAASFFVKENQIPQAMFSFEFHDLTKETKGKIRPRWILRFDFKMSQKHAAITKKRITEALSGRDDIKFTSTQLIKQQGLF